MNVKELAEKIYEIGLPLNRADTISATESILTAALMDAHLEERRYLYSMEMDEFAEALIKQAKAAAYQEGYNDGSSGKQKTLS